MLNNIAAIKEEVGNAIESIENELNHLNHFFMPNMGVNFSIIRGNGIINIQIRKEDDSLSSTFPYVYEYTEKEGLVFRKEMSSVTMTLDELKDSIRSRVNYSVFRMRGDATNHELIVKSVSHYERKLMITANLSSFRRYLEQSPGVTAKLVNDSCVSMEYEGKEYLLHIRPNINTDIGGYNYEAIIDCNRDIDDWHKDIGHIINVFEQAVVNSII